MTGHDRQEDDVLNALVPPQHASSAFGRALPPQGGKAVRGSRPSDDRYEAMVAIRQLVSRVVMTPAAKCGEVQAVLYGDIVAIADWVSQGVDKLGKGHLITL